MKIQTQDDKAPPVAKGAVAEGGRGRTGTSVGPGGEGRGMLETYSSRSAWLVEDVRRCLMCGVLAPLLLLISIDGSINRSKEKGRGKERGVASSSLM